MREVVDSLETFVLSIRPCGKIFLYAERSIDCRLRGFQFPRGVFYLSEIIFLNSATWPINRLFKYSTSKSGRLWMLVVFDYLLIANLDQRWCYVLVWHRRASAKGFEEPEQSFPAQRLSFRIRGKGISLIISPGRGKRNMTAFKHRTSNEPLKNTLLIH